MSAPDDNKAKGAASAAPEALAAEQSRGAESELMLAQRAAASAQEDLATAKKRIEELEAELAEAHKLAEALDDESRKLEANAKVALEKKDQAIAKLKGDLAEAQAEAKDARAMLNGRPVAKGVVRCKVAHGSLSFNQRTYQEGDIVDLPADEAKKLGSVVKPIEK